MKTIAATIMFTIMFTTTPASVQAAERRPAHFSYMAFGDSITYGIGTTNPETRSYPTQAGIRGYGVGSACITQHTHCTPNLYVFNWWPQHLESMANPPKVAVMMLGTNDYAASTPTQITRAMRRLATIGKRHGVRVVFGTITPAPAGSYWNTGPSGNGKATRLAVNTWIRDHDWLQGPEYAKPLSCGDALLCPGS